ncbi:hypothetical protein AB0K80_33690 [Streptomyces sp. NPDC052682]|uniref:hypothetical protein n=1 Tax=Streptomyces sp. NPDC052682 TaxID=3154954 RepID=UPI00343860AE
MITSTHTEYGIASESHEDIEPLGQVSRSRAEAIVDDSSEAWPDVYLVQRHGDSSWERA